MAIGTAALTGVEFGDRIRYGFNLDGRPVVVEEDHEAAFRGLRIEGATLAGRRTPKRRHGAVLHAG
jgi:hypothetical protein